MIDKLLNDKRQVVVRQAARYAMVGIASNLAGYLVYLCLTHFVLAPKVAMTLLYAIGATIGYVGNRRFTFEHNGDRLNSGLRYLVAHLLAYLINLAILIIFVDHLAYTHQWVQGAAIFVVAGFLFMAFKFFVFTKSSSVEAATP